MIDDRIARGELGDGRLGGVPYGCTHQITSGIYAKVCAQYLDARVLPHILLMHHRIQTRYVDKGNCQCDHYV